MRLRMRGPSKRVLKKTLQKIFWVYLTKNFYIRDKDDFKVINSIVQCSFTPIKTENYTRVQDFRESSYIAEFRDKLANGEIGFFSECGGKVIGSIWATVNHSAAPRVARTYMRLMPNESLIHDI